MKRPSGAYRVFAAGLAAILLCIAFPAAPARAATVTEKRAPAGDGAYTFTVDVLVDIDNLFAGIQFEASLSDESKLTFNSFKLSRDVTGATIYPLIHHHDIFNFGFWMGENTFSGEMVAGTMEFTYTGSAPQTITLSEALIVRIGTNNRPAGTQMTATMPHTIQVSRAAPGEDIGGDHIQILLTENPTPLSGLGRSRYFDDVDEAWFWAVEAIDSLYEAGVVKGIGNRLYKPGDSITRGDFTLMLARAYQFENDPFDGNFPDVPEDSYYYNAIGAAKALGIAEGDGTYFNPLTPITRQDMMVLINRTLKTMGRPLPVGAASLLDAFADTERMASYAREAVAALVQSGIVLGNDRGELNPFGNTTRAEMAVVLYRVLTLDGPLALPVAQEPIPQAAPQQETPPEPVDPNAMQTS